MISSTANYSSQFDEEKFGKTSKVAVSDTIKYSSPTKIISEAAITNKNTNSVFAFLDKNQTNRVNLGESLGVQPPPQSSQFQELYVVLQNWEGCVESVETDSFTARLEDRTHSENVESEAASIPLDEVDEDDQILIKQGAIFYLTIIRKTLQTGRREVTSKIVFRRLPLWHKSTLDSVEDEARELAEYFAEKPSHAPQHR